MSDKIEKATPVERHPQAVPALETGRKLGFDEMLKVADALADSPLIPTQYLGTKEKKFERGQVRANLFLAMHYGQEVGLSALQAIQSVTVINGRAALFGDGLLGVALGSGQVEDMTESYDAITKIATCTVWRRGKKTPVVRTFSWDQAVKANLPARNPVYAAFPDRMLQMRARALALRDALADVLKGLNAAEIVEDDERPMTNITPPAEKVEPKADAKPEPTVIEQEAAQEDAGQKEAEADNSVRTAYTLPLAIGIDAKGNSDYKGFYSEIDKLLDDGSPAERKMLMSQNHNAMVRLKATHPVLAEMLAEKALA